MFYKIALYMSACLLATKNEKIALIKPMENHIRRCIFRHFGNKR